MEVTDTPSLKENKNVKVNTWIKLIAVAGSGQMIVQILSLASGILVIRLLSTREYAFYTIANTMLGTMTVLADGGIGAGVMAQGGKIWQDKDKLGTVLATGLHLRKIFAIGSLLVSIPILLFLLFKQNASIYEALIIVLTLIPAFYAALSDSILEIGPKLHQAIKKLQYNQVKVALIRLVFTVTSVFIFPWTAVLLLANGIPRIYGNISLRKIAYSFASKSQEVNDLIKKDILKVVKRMLPEICYYCLSGQLNIWLISLFGSTTALASLGALGRLAMLFTFFSTLFNILIVPRFARLPDQKHKMLRYVVFIFLGIMFISGAAILISYFFADNILLILGNKYLGLHKELILSVINSCVSILSGSFFSLLISRGWAIHPVPYILINIITTIVAALTLNVSSLQGVLYFNISISVVQSIVLIGYCLYKINSHKATSLAL